MRRPSNSAKRANCVIRLKIFHPTLDPPQPVGGYISGIVRKWFLPARRKPNHLKPKLNHRIKLRRTAQRQQLGQ